MKHEFHSLLPTRAQTALRAANKVGLNDTIKEVMLKYPISFHNDDTLDKRVFFDQPIGPIGNAKFIHAAPASFTRKPTK